MGRGWGLAALLGPLLGPLLVGPLLMGMAGPAWGQSPSRPTGTQGVTGNPNCPPPVINGITPKNWSCPTGTQRVPQAAAPPVRRDDPTTRPLAVDRCVARAGRPYGLLLDMHDMASLVFDNYKAGAQPIFIARISNMTNPKSYLVALSGTQVLLDRLQQTTGLGEDMLASLAVRDAYSRSVFRALQAYDGGRGVPGYAHLILVGHSLGGMVAQNVAADPDFSTRWNPRAVITLGSPRTVNLGLGVVRRFAADGDQVPMLSPATWGFGGFDPRAQHWIDPMPPGRWVDPYTAHMNYPRSRALYEFDALGVPRAGRQGNVLVLDAAGQMYCPAQVL